jgi:thioredoxin-related protein
MKRKKVISVLIFILLFFLLGCTKDNEERNVINQLHQVKTNVTKKFL